MKNTKGIALIFTVGILALMALIGTSFALNTIMDLRSAKMFESTVKVKFLAQFDDNKLK